MAGALHKMCCDVSKGGGRVHQLDDAVRSAIGALAPVVMQVMRPNGTWEMSPHWEAADSRLSNT